jgi:hypothetical protein
MGSLETWTLRGNSSFYRVGWPSISAVSLTANRFGFYGHGLPCLKEQPKVNETICKLAQTCDPGKGNILDKNSSMIYIKKRNRFGLVASDTAQAQHFTNFSNDPFQLCNFKLHTS